MVIICAIYPTVASAEEGVEALKLVGVGRANIRVLFTGNVGPEAVDGERLTGAPYAGKIAAGNSLTSALSRLGLSKEIVGRYASQIVENDAVFISVQSKTNEQGQQVSEIL